MSGLVIENSLPGVTVLVNNAQVARPIQRQPSSTAFIVGYAVWGPPNVPTTVTSFPDFVRQFGGFDSNSYLDDFCYAFFNLMGGKQAVVCRVVGAAAAVATVSLQTATPHPTLKIDALYPSSSVDVKYLVEAGTQANTFKLTVRSVALNVKEVYDNLKIDADSISLVNNASQLVKLTNLNAVDVAPANLPVLTNPEAALAGGNDDFAGIVAATYVGADSGTTKTGLQVFNDEGLGGGQVAVPGITDSTTRAALIAHAEAYHRVAFPDPPLGSDKSAVATIRAAIGSYYAAMYWPWVQMLDFAGSGAKKFYPPSAFAAGACATVDRTIGTHKAPANLQIPGALDVERYANGQSQIDENTREFLNSKDVNVIAPLPEQGVKIYGARVMKPDTRIRWVHEIRLLNLFYYSAKIAYQWAPFSVLDGTGRLFRDLVSTGRGFLLDFWRSNALFGAKETDAFQVIADDNNNPPAELDAGRVHVDWRVKLSPTAETIIVSINNARSSDDLSVLQ
jgi:uncharacterized protein